MEILILTGTLMSAFFVGFFVLGYYIGIKSKGKDAYVVKTKEQIENLNGIAEWINFGGKS